MVVDGGLRHNVVNEQHQAFRLPQLENLNSHRATTAQVRTAQHTIGNGLGVARRTMTAPALVVCCGGGEFGGDGSPLVKLRHLMQQIATRRSAFGLVFFSFERNAGSRF
jgi:hypothetical protein